MAEPTISKPNWATEDVIDPVTGRINVQEPPSSKVEQGLARGDFIPRQWFNWLFRSCGAWITWLYSENADRIEAIAAETVAREEYDSILSNRITAEEEERAGSISLLNGYINDEAATRAAADTTLGNNLASEASTRMAQDGILADAIVNEHAAWEAAIAALRTPEVLSLQDADGTDSPNVGTGETVLYTFLIPGGKMKYEGDHVEIDASVFLGTGGGQKSVRCFVGAEDVFDNGPCTLDTRYGRLRITIVRKLSGGFPYTGWAVGSYAVGVDSGGAAGLDYEGRYVSGGVFAAAVQCDWSVDQTVTIRGQSASGSGNVVGQYMMAKFTPISKAA